jgi:exopolyphosphatase/pppGpp-phosphohydrolase
MIATDGGGGAASGEAAARNTGSSWEVAIGTSGTIRALRAVLRAEGWTDGAITRAALARAGY